jgi:hypothetical protein
MNRYQDLLPPLWNTIALTVSALVTNGAWASWFRQADGTGLAVLLIYSLLGWPLMLALVYLVVAYTLRFCEDLAWLRMVIVLGVVAAGTAVFGVPGPWNLLLCATVAIAAGLQARRTAQDDADLEDL